MVKGSLPFVPRALWGSGDQLSCMSLPGSWVVVTHQFICLHCWCGRCGPALGTLLALLVLSEYF